MGEKEENETTRDEKQALPCMDKVEKHFKTLGIPFKTQWLLQNSPSIDECMKLYLATNLTETSTPCLKLYLTTKGTSPIILQVNERLNVSKSLYSQINPPHSMKRKKLVSLEDIEEKENTEPQQFLKDSEGLYKFILFDGFDSVVAVTSFPLKNVPRIGSKIRLSNVSIWNGCIVIDREFEILGGGVESDEIPKLKHLLEGRSRK